MLRIFYDFSSRPACNLPKVAYSMCVAESSNQPTKQRRLGMKKLAELVKVEENNENCVLLKVKPKSTLELMKIGFFNGNEQYFRVTKSKRFAMHTLTVWRKNENAWSISWGTDIACVTEMQRKMCLEVVDCIVNDFGISIDKQ